tara:strand:+ start:331 stop:1158 length:828 start_codon:yes stop_codon:yes gene_type:complete
MDFNKIKRLIEKLGLKPVFVYLKDLYSYFFRFQKVTRDGLKFKLDLHEVIDRGIFFGGWEPESIEWIKRNIKSGDIVIEVGANVGAHSLLIAKKIQPNGFVHLFEPAEYAYSKLNENLKLNPEINKNTKVYKTLLSNKSSDYKNVRIRSSWIFNKTEEIEDQMDEFLNGKSETLDNIFSRIEKLDLIKIDVDGFDFKVLKGSENLIKKFKPKIFVELNDIQLKKNGDTVEDILIFLKSFGYKGMLEQNVKVENYEQVMEIIESTPTKYTNAYFDI